MAFGVSAVVAGAAIVGTAVVGASIYSGRQQKKALGKQAQAMQEAIAADKKEAAAAEADAAMAANLQIADTKRRRRSSSLAAGEPDVLGASSVLGGGSQAVSVGSKPTSALGKGAA